MTLYVVVIWFFMDETGCRVVSSSKVYDFNVGKCYSYTIYFVLQCL